MIFLAFNVFNVLIGSQRKNLSNLKARTHTTILAICHRWTVSSMDSGQKKEDIKKKVNECRMRFSTWNIGTLRGKA